MKNIVSFLLVLIGFAGIAQPDLNKLKFDSEKYFYRRTPGNGQASYQFTVNISVPSVELISSDGGQGIQKFKTNGNGNFGGGKPVTIVAIPLLYEVAPDGFFTLFKFGQNAAEDDLNSAEVYIGAIGEPVSTSSVTSTIRPPVDVSIDKSEFYVYPGGAARTNQNYLYVEANSSQTQTIRLEREPRRGQVYVCIFDRNGNLLATLDPKDRAGTETPSFTVDKPVFVVPVIASKYIRSGGNDNVTFEVGDPKEIATVEVIEE